ncbi:AraC family transcriptional regulator [Paenibacillus soyae]|uniref:AraC family transcriptional regulator n=1 Tax=Paenibacillus soyae TaxID=2969249 RepID=A0A9X2MLL6_9BACL|nr:AraC family transcriptional regulator [Paenibacillus soyae]MCR2802480.1 AraC family transcriptional regulator [Paenibacillus soyae]
MRWTWGSFTRSVAFRWIVSYSVILFIPVLLSIFIYSQTRDIVENEIKRASSAMLQQVRYIVDGELQQTESLAAQLMINTDVLKLLEKTSTDSENAYLVYRMKQEFNKQLSSNDFIKGIYVFSSAQGAVLSSETYVEERMFFEMKHHTESFAYEDWLGLMKERQPGKYVMLPVELQGKRTMTPSYIRSFPEQAGGGSSGTLLFPLNAEKIKAMLENIDWVEQGQVFIMDSNNQILFRSSGDAAESLSVFPDWNDRGTGTFTDTIEGVESTITLESSDTTGWKYVSVFPTDVFWERTRAIQTMNLLGLVACMVIGGMVIYYFSRKNYNPVKQLMSVFSRGPQEVRGADLDEYSFIRNSVLETIRERDDINNKHVQQLKVLQNYYLGRLLKGQADRSMPLAEMAKTHHLAWTSDRFAVLLFYIESDGVDEAVLSLSPFIVSNIMTDVVKDRLPLHFTDVDGTLAAVVNVDPEREHSWKDDIEDALAQASEFISARYDLRFTMSGSELQTGIHGIHQAFLQSLEAQEYRMVLGEEMLIWYGDVQPSGSGYFFTVNDQMILINFLKADEFEKAKQMVDRVAHQAFQSQASLEIAKFVLLDVATTLIKTIPEQEQSGIAWDEWRPLKRLLGCATKADFHRELLDILERVVAVLRCKPTVQTSVGIGDKVLEYVSEHYNDKNLSVSLIGDHFRLSPQYVSRLFREQTGQGLHDYISQTRVEAAKKLLLEGTSIDETAGQVGFASGHAFIRVFKKYEGITPGKYKTIQ